jgi:trehalose-6-phosphatase
MGSVRARGSSRPSTRRRGRPCALLTDTGLRRALYAGDDVTDLDGFRALDGLELAVRIAIASAEGPSELGELADLVVGSPEAFLELLRRI